MSKKYEIPGYTLVIHFVDPYNISFFAYISKKIDINL